MDKLDKLVNQRTTRKRPLAKLTFTLAPNVDLMVKVSMWRGTALVCVKLKHGRGIGVAMHAARSHKQYIMVCRPKA
jgi:hypothetical protein